MADKSATIDDPFLYVSKFRGYLSMHIKLLVAKKNSTCLILNFKHAEDYVLNAHR